ncbi:hypothetical protein QEN19_001817 [Hanseniaspora menglaensis]
MVSNSLEQQQHFIKRSGRKSSIDKIEMMRFLEQLIQDEDQQRYQQSLQQENIQNLSPKSAENSPTPFNTSALPRRSFSRGESALSTSKFHRDTTLSNIYEDESLNNLVINFQYSNANNSIRLMDDERDRLRELIQHDEENVNIPPMFMQRHMEQKKSETNSYKRRYSSLSISNVTPEPDQIDKRIVVDESEVLDFNDLDIDLQNFENELSNSSGRTNLTPPVSSIASPKLFKDQKMKIKHLKQNIEHLQNTIEEKNKTITDLSCDAKIIANETNQKIAKMQKTESLLILQIRKDRELIKKLVKEVAFKDKVNLELAQEMKQLKQRSSSFFENIAHETL